MAITLLASLIIMAAYFLLLYGGVGFIQDKRFFASAPQENLAAIPDRKERFRGAHMFGYNKRTHLIHFAIYLPASAAAAALCTLLCT